MLKDGKAGTEGPTISEINQRQIVNHFECHSLITEKFNLLFSLQKQADLHKENVFDITPITFYLEVPNVTKESALNQAMLPFLQYYQALEDNKHIIPEIKVELAKLKEKEMEQELLNQEKEGSNEDGKKEPDEGTPDGDDSEEANEMKEEAGFENFGKGDEAEEVNSNQADQSPEIKKKKEVAPKSLLNTGPGYSTLYKTISGKEQHNQKSTKFKQFNFEKR